MLRHQRLEHRFVHYIPEELEPGIIYISMHYATAAHSCCCGCGEQVITPLTPTDWKMTFDGETISLWPSIGNWNFRCRSHYIIRNSRILVAEPWQDKKVESERRHDKKGRPKQHGEKSGGERQSIPPAMPPGNSPGLWDRLKEKVRKRRP